MAAHLQILKDTIFRSYKEWSYIIDSKNNGRFMRTFVGGVKDVLSAGRRGHVDFQNRQIPLALTGPNHKGEDHGGKPPTKQ